MIEDDWKELQQSWQAEGGEKRARRHRLGARRAMVLDLIFAAFWIGVAAWMSIRSDEEWVLVWALTITVLFAIALAYAAWNRRDALWPSSVAPLDFLAQAELRCRRQLQMLRFMVRFGAVEVVISLALFWFGHRESLLMAVASLAVFCAGGLVWARRTRRLAERELEEIARLRRELERDD